MTARLYISNFGGVSLEVLFYNNGIMQVNNITLANFVHLYTTSILAFSVYMYVCNYFTFKNFAHELNIRSYM